MQYNIINLEFGTTIYLDRYLILTILTKKLKAKKKKTKRRKKIYNAKREHFEIVKIEKVIN